MRSQKAHTALAAFPCIMSLLSYAEKAAKAVCAF